MSDEVCMNANNWRLDDLMQVDRKTHEALQDANRMRIDTWHVSGKTRIYLKHYGHSGCFFPPLTQITFFKATR